MERQVLFLQTLFILLVTSYVAYACICNLLTLQESLCPENNRTVLIANVKKMDTNLDANGNATTDPNAPNGRYEMNLEQTFKNGSNPLDTDNGVFFMYFPRNDTNCGRIFNKSDSYLLTGSVDHSGDFHSSTCEHVIPKADVVSNSTTMNILQGNHTLNCTHF
ncbi:hypothetical protein ACJMK2_032698 [Sinanodonta woodiana]|uniref:NTR domain-containing protein n=1 Tax=Sinanodonta woodiana TaxID=1069815 RepID=A0ABD3X2I5_SINWO